MRGLRGAHGVLRCAPSVSCRRYQAGHCPPTLMLVAASQRFRKNPKRRWLRADDRCPLLLLLHPSPVFLSLLHCWRVGRGLLEPPSLVPPVRMILLVVSTVPAALKRGAHPPHSFTPRSLVIENRSLSRVCPVLGPIECCLRACSIVVGFPVSNRCLLTVAHAQATPRSVL